MENLINDNISKACVEILEIIEYIGREYKSKIPKKFLDWLETNKNKSYKYEFNKRKSLKEQKLLDETIGILSIIELKYWANSTQKEALIEALTENEKRYQEKLREKYNPNNIFNNKLDIKIDKIQETTDFENNDSLVEIKESFFAKFIKKLKNIFSMK